MQEYLRNFVHMVVVVIGLGGFQISWVARYHELRYDGLLSPSVVHVHYIVVSQKWENIAIDPNIACKNLYKEN
jgi:hypothetical protein